MEEKYLFDDKKTNNIFFQNATIERSKGEWQVI